MRLEGRGGHFTSAGGRLSRIGGEPPPAPSAARASQRPAGLPQPALTPSSTTRQPADASVRPHRRQAQAAPSPTVSRRGRAAPRGRRRAASAAPPPTATAARDGPATRGRAWSPRRSAPLGLSRPPYQPPVAPAAGGQRLERVDPLYGRIRPAKTPPAGGTPATAAPPLDQGGPTAVAGSGWKEPREGRSGSAPSERPPLRHPASWSAGL
jgi:hypothetical protein